MESLEDLEDELPLVKLLFIFGFLFLLWVGQVVDTQFVCTSKENDQYTITICDSWSIYEACMNSQID